jgi:hypothetical protein
MLWCDDQERRRNRSPSWMEATEDAPVMLVGEHHARLLEADHQPGGLGLAGRRQGSQAVGALQRDLSPAWAWRTSSSIGNPQALAVDASRATVVRTIPPDRVASIIRSG